MVFGLFDEDEGVEEAPAAQYGQQAFTAAGSAYEEEDVADIEAVQAEQEAETQAQVLEIFQAQEREVEEYSQGELNSVTLRTRANNPDPQDPDQEPAFIRSSANFLFGDEMAIMGIKWDKDGLTWKAETAEEMWSDHPIMASVALAGVAFPFVGALRKSAKVGKLAVAGAQLAAGEQGIGLAGDVYKAGRKLGILPETLLKSDDWTKLGDELLEAVDEDAIALGAKTQVLKYFDDDFAAVVKAEVDPTKRLEMLGGRKRLQEILLESDKRQRMLDLKATVESGNGTQAQIVQYALQKRFANTYFNIGNRVGKEYVRNMNKFWDNAKLDELFKHELADEDHLLYYKYLNDKHDPADFAKLTPSKQQYFERTRNRYWQHQRDAVESGFMTPETVARIGPAHVAALRKGSEAVTEAADVSRKQSILERGGIIRHYPKLKSPTLLERVSTLDEVIDAAARGELVTHIEDVHRTSIVKDEMLHVGYKLMRDVALRAGDTATNRYAIKAEAFDALSDTAKKAWVSLDDIPGKGVGERLKRMVAKSLGKTPDEIDRLPYVHQNVIDEMFDPEGGMMMAGHNVANAISLLTAMHKPAKTVFNLPSHFQNVVSNLLYFMPMAGVNPFKGDVISDMKRANSMVWGIAKEVAAKKGDAATILSSREALLDLAKKSNVDTVITTNVGTKLDLVDEIMDPRVRQMIEEQSFDNAEGFSAIHQFYEALEKKGKEAYLDNATAALAKIYVNTVEKTDKILEKTIKTPLLKRMSAAYLAEDMTPKLATYMQFRKRGLSIEQSVMMVSRKFPQYKTVGKTIQGARKYAFPWATFPAEVTRIMRNNMTDRPLASAMWFQAAGMQQAVMSGIGFAPSDPAEIEAAKEGAPFWANKPSTVITSAAGQGVVGGGFTGAALGGMAGGLKAGPLGFAVGSAAGAVIGAGIGAYGSKGEDSLRAWTLDFLPHSAVLPQSYDTHMDPGSNMVKEFLKTSPVEPLSVMMPLVRLFMGEDEYGQEIVGEGKLDYLNKAIVQTAGIITPPWIQKYGLRVGAPDKGMFGLDQVSTMALGGTAAALMGGRIGLQAGGVTGAAIGAAAGATAGLALGSQIDTSRFEEDIGLRTNSRTGEPGNLVYDVLFTSMTGLGKSWKADPGQKAFNDKLREDNLKTFRTSVKRKMQDAAMNGDEERWNALMQDYFITYTQQYDDPRQAQAKFHASMEDFIPQLRRSPQYKRLSQEELEARLMEASTFAIQHRGQFSDQRVEELRSELLNRAVAKHRKGDAIGFDEDIDFGKGGSFGSKTFW